MHRILKIICKNANLGYESGIVVKDLNFVISKGDYLCILGENGSGKSTLIKALLGLKPQLSGEISFGKGIGKNEIGYLPQQTIVQRDFPASVSEIVQSGCMNRCGFRPFYSKEEKKLASKMMKKLDEPVTGLDPKATLEMYELIAKLNQQGITIIMVSHDMNAAVKYASHILHIGGRQLFFGEKSDYLNSKVGQAFLEAADAGGDIG